MCKDVGHSRVTRFRASVLDFFLIFEKHLRQRKNLLVSSLAPAPLAGSCCAFFVCVSCRWLSSKQQYGCTSDGD